MLIHASGDLLSSPAQVRTCTVNCVGVMGKGVALQFRHHYPGLLSDYQQWCRTGRIVAGGMPRLWGGQVLLFPTKDHWRHPSELRWIASSLALLAEGMRRAPDVISSLAIPPLGCGLGGLAWLDVLPLIEQHLGPLPQTIYVYAPHG